MVRSTTPIVSIGLPVYNGEKYLAEAIQSFLDQTFEDFELIICDNASTDHTEEICRKFEALDSRIRYTRNKTNLGATRNHNLVYELSKGQYFKWAGHDDLYAPNYLLECVNVLDSDQGIVLCYPKTILIDEFGHETGRYEEDDLDLSSASPHERLHNMLHHPLHLLLSPSYGLARSSNLARTAGYGNYLAADRVILAELALQGPFERIPEYLFYRRIHPENSTTANPSAERMAVWMDPALKGRAQAPRWKRFIDNLNRIRRASLNPRERLLCYGEFWSFYLNPRRFNGIRSDVKQFIATRLHHVKH
jgi:glycosyltransferase involved in cell wall biosynthesis